MSLQLLLVRMLRSVDPLCEVGDDVNCRIDAFGEHAYDELQSLQGLGLDVGECLRLLGLQFLPFAAPFGALGVLPLANRAT